MRDVSVFLDGKLDRLAEAARALGRAGINIEGGCATQVGPAGAAHFLVADAAAARRALEADGIRVLADQEVLVVSLDQDEPGQFAKLAQAMSDGGVRVEAFYGDHEHHDILVVDDVVKGRAIASAWAPDRGQNGAPR